MPNPGPPGLQGALLFTQSGSYLDLDPPPAAFQLPVKWHRNTFQSLPYNINYPKSDNIQIPRFRFNMNSMNKEHSKSPQINVTCHREPEVLYLTMTPKPAGGSPLSFSRGKHRYLRGDGERAGGLTDRSLQVTGRTSRGIPDQLCFRSSSAERNKAKKKKKRERTDVGYTGWGGAHSRPKEPNFKHIYC